MERIAIASGYFDPLHIGHIEYLEEAKKIADKLIVIVNNDKQAELKKGKAFMPEKERLMVVSALRCVDYVYLSCDYDKTVCESIRNVFVGSQGDKVMFCKGGDRTAGEIPEGSICKALGIEIVDELGNKIQSSSELIKKWEKN